MNRIKAILMIVFIVSSLVIIVSSKKKDNKTPILCYMTSGLTNGFNIQSTKYMEKFGEKLGYKVKILNANRSAEKQIQQIETAISTGVSALVIKAVDNKLIVDVIKKAKKKGIKILIYDNIIDGCQTDMTSVLDTEKVGEMVADECIRVLTNKYRKAQGNIFQIMGDLGDMYSIGIAKGFNNKIKKYKDVKVITKDTPHWEGQDKILDLELNKNKNIDIVFMHSDSHMTLLTNVLKKHKYKQGDIKLIGTDGDPDALKEIRSGWCHATIGVPVVSQVWGIFNFLKSIENGKTIKSGNYLIRDLNCKLVYKNKSPISYLPGIVITKDNVDDKTLWGNMHEF